MNTNKQPTPSSELENSIEKESLEKAIEEVEKLWSLHPKEPDCDCSQCKVIRAAKQSRELQEQLSEYDKEIGEFQNSVKNLIDEMADSNVDGGGCDSGDWRDFTLSEISQGLAHVIDQRDELKKQSLSDTALIEELVQTLKLLLPIKTPPENILVYINAYDWGVFMQKREEALTRAKALGYGNQSAQSHNTKLDPR